MNHRRIPGTNIMPATGLEKIRLMVEILKNVQVKNIPTMWADGPDDAEGAD